MSVKDRKDLTNIIIQLDLPDSHKTVHPTTTEYTFFSSAHGTFTKIDHVLGHKTSLNKLKLKKNQVLQSMFTGHNEIKLGINTERYLENPQIPTNK